MKIEIAGQALDLSDNFGIDIEDSNPIWNEVGSQSVPATVPATPRNCRLLDFPNRVDASVHPNAPMRTAYIKDGAYIRSGKMNVTEAGKIEGITFNVGFDNSTAYVEWTGKKLAELPRLPVYYPSANMQPDKAELLKQLYKIYQYGRPTLDPFAVFPIAVNNPEPSGSDDKNKKIYWEMLNTVTDSAMWCDSRVTRVIDGEVTEVAVPAAYGVTPFLRVWRVIEVAFAALGMKIESNPFKTDKELSRLVVLNNCADACCLGYVKYSDLLPDCTIGEFFHSLWVRFGLVYTINYDRRRVSLRLIRDIIKDSPKYDLLPMLTDRPVITYNAQEYVKLGAKTSLDNAAPPADRFEDFIQGQDIDRILVGGQIPYWKRPGLGWEGDDRDGFWEMDDPDPDDWQQEPIEPEFPDYDPDDYDYDTYSVNAPAAPVSEGAEAVEDKPDPSFAREYVTGDWYRLDNDNGLPERLGSAFFQWDPQPDGYTAVDLSSEDECVPVGWVSQLPLEIPNPFIGYCPLYLVGCRHYHSYIKGGAKKESDGSTPLAFMIAYTKGGSTIGRLSPESMDGQPIVMADGSVPTLTLFFQFRDGLFAQFWAGYDELLRYASRTVTVHARCPKEMINSLNLIEPVTLQGVRFLIDTLSYSLPAGREIEVEFNLRPLMPQGSYNIIKEQKIPAFSIANKKLVWQVDSETFDTAGEDGASRLKAAKKYIELSGYTAHGDVGDPYCVDGRSAVVDYRTRVSTWETDSTLTPPYMFGQTLSKRTYKAEIHYLIFEVLDFSRGPEDDERDNWMLSKTPLADVALEVEYTVNLIARWVDK